VKERAVTRKPVDVIIIGAGAAGLAAARDLSHKGLRLTVLEARDRLGGRILTRRNSLSAEPVELGAEFVHGEPGETLAIVRAAKLILDRLPDDHYRSEHGKFSLIGDYWGKLAELRRDIATTMRRATGDYSLAQYLDRKDITGQSRNLLINIAEDYNAARAAEISASSVAFEEGENNKQFRVVTGYDAIMQWLRMGLGPQRAEIRLNTAATDIRWRRGKVVVQCQSRTGAELVPFHARAAIITIPAALLRAKTLRFVLALSEKERAVENSNLVRSSKRSCVSDRLYGRTIPT
jgi:monoamine oxidase